MHLPSPLLTLATRAREAGGHAWIVGGGVRDHLLGQRPKDFDVEVHGLPAADLERVLRRLGQVKAVGRSFGVFKLRPRDLPALELDVSLPQPGRATTPQGEPIIIDGDPDLGLTEALRRRDLTINAIAYDPLTEDYADPFGGRADLSAGVLRAVDPETFGDDPLRVMRVMQFAGRTGFGLDPALAPLCRALPIAGLPGERLEAELTKLLMRSPVPSVGLRAGRAVGALERTLPMLAAADGPALEAAVDRAAATERGPATQPLAVMWGVLLHRCEIDAATAVLDRLRIFTAGGYPLRARLLHAVGAWPRLLEETVSDATLRWLAEDGEVELTARIAWAASGDARARRALARAGALGITTRPAPRLLLGRDLQALGIPPGPWMGRILRAVRAEQLDGTIADKQAATARAGQLWKEEEDSRGTP